MTDREKLIELAERLKSTVRLARAYSKGTGSIFEEAMNVADRLAERTLIDLRHTSKETNNVAD